ncbi:NAD-dependent DNA ligase LigA [Mycoplasma sp. ATU-Cv-703]|uniref:NAD-dependent DNA ligase LigA n=1 Tax=Mycoplasma sp. ATU-Cv-703 TaxID=2498595 RepID=UPI000FDEC870
MNEKKAAQKVAELRRKLERWSKEYYEKDAPSVSDAVYDAAYLQLEKLEQQFPSLVSPDSITQRIGGKVDQRFQKVAHSQPMMSLANAFDEADLIRFDQHIMNQLARSQPLEYVCELKIDGVSIALIYRQGILTQALTRGDGLVGEDVTHNVKMIADIPYQIPSKQEVEFRGEIYLSHQVFNQLNSQTDQRFANPRNAAAGTLRQLDAKVVQKRRLNAFFYALVNPLAHQLPGQKDVLDFIKSQGLPIEPHGQVVVGIKAAVKQTQKLADQAKKLNYDTDGVVIKVNDLKLYEDIGQTAKYPKSMIAYKFAEEVGQTKLNAIFPSIGRTGRVTYNAKLEPIRLAGTIVSAATLHNADYVRERSINVGDVVKVKKSGAIIPRVLGVARKVNSQPWQEATHCPRCQTRLLRLTGEVDQYCPNINCPARILASLEHFVSKGAMDIRGLSTMTLELFLSEKLVSDLPSIFALDAQRDRILELPKFSDKSTANLLKAIEEAKSRPLAKFIYGLGIRHVGAKTAKILSQRFGSLDNLASAEPAQIEQILTLGPAVTNSVHSFFTDPANIKMLSKFAQLGLKLEQSEVRGSQNLVGVNFVLTGTLSLPREKYVSMIEAQGGNVTSAVTQRTNYLVVGQDPGSKLVKAEQLKIKVIEEKQLKKILQEEV